MIFYIARAILQYFQPSFFFCKFSQRSWWCFSGNYQEQYFSLLDKKRKSMYILFKSPGSSPILSRSIFLLLWKQITANWISSGISIECLYCKFQVVITIWKLTVNLSEVLDNAFEIDTRCGNNLYHILNFHLFDENEIRHVAMLALSS